MLFVKRKMHYFNCASNTEILVKKLDFFLGGEGRWSLEADRNSFSFWRRKWANWSFSAFSFWAKNEFSFLFYFRFRSKMSFALGRKCYVRN